MTGHGAIVHEWIEPTGGAEKVVDRFAYNFPDAPIYALWNDDPNRFETGRVHESWLARTPLRGRKALSVPIMPVAWRGLKGSFDWIICSSHLFAHHASMGSGSAAPIKLVYAYTPARYIWEPDVDDRGASLPVRAAAAALRPLDRKRSREANSVAAISEFVRQRIGRTWGIDSRVIYPPVAVRDFTKASSELEGADAQVIASLPETYLLGASRFVPYKRLEAVIAAGEAAGLPVVLAGGGPQEARLRQIAAEASIPVRFVPRPSQGLLIELYKRARAFVFPALEDFGIMPVEAMATGTPVIGLREGGVGETVLHGRSGYLIESFDSVEQVVAAVDAVGSLDREVAVDRAWEFDETRFDVSVKSWVDEATDSTRVDYKRGA